MDNQTKPPPGGMDRRGHSQEPPRRDFFKRASACILGGAAAVIPALSAVFMALDPLRTRAREGKSVRVGFLSALPADGTPRKFPIIASKVDAWNRHPETPIGAVYLRRTTNGGVQAFNVVCPHAGCFVEYVTAKKNYLCPCHNSAFELGGARIGASSPSPRGLDELAVEIRNKEEIWVVFQNFLTGHADKTAQA